MKFMRRGLSWLLVLCMIFGMLSLSAFAVDETETPAEESVVEEIAEPAAEVEEPAEEAAEPAAEAEEPAEEAEEEVVEVEDEAMEATEQPVTVTVGATTVVTTTGANNAGTYTTGDPSVATVAVTGTDAVDATVKYNSASNVKASSIATSTSWTKTSYYYKASDGEYYPVYAYYQTSGYWWSSTTTYYWGYSTTDSSSNVTSIDNTTSSSTKVSGLYTKTGTDAVAATTTITFSGVAEGTTSVVIGGVTYNITVTGEDLSKVTAQTVHLYISTFAVWAVGDSSKTSTVSISAQDAYGVEGIDISSKVPATGSWAYAASSSDASTVFWKGVKLTYENRQSATSNTDRSMSGVNYDKIRYYGGKWSVHDMDNNVWVDIASDDEVDAYYLQKTEITSEVTTYVKDWAYTTSNCTSASGSNVQKALSFAVVYPDGQLSPATEDAIYTDSTLIYWNTTQNMFIRVGVNEVYEVEKITYTAGERINSDGTEYGSTTGNWKSTDRISWDKTTTADGSTWYDETTCWTPETSSEPVIDCSQIDAFSYSKGYYTTNDAILVLIYLKPVTTEDSLTVKYVDDTNDNEFLSYSVNVTNTSTEDKGTFLNRLTDNGIVIGGNGPWTGKTADEANYLPDTAYVTNAKGTNETFQKDLTKIPSLMGTSYGSGFYGYVKAEISEDGKTLTLHYNQKSDVTSDVEYVIDFGLSVNIPVTDLGTSGTVQSVTVGSAFYGDVTVDGTTSITYTPNRILKSYDVFRVNLVYSDKTITKTVKIYPASTVYYDEGFLNGGKTTDTETQTASKVGSKDRYGYDARYASVLQSGELKSTAAGEIATFEFTGTGFDLYVNTTSTTGKMTVRVYNEDNQLVNLALIDTVSKNEDVFESLTGDEKYGLVAYSRDDLDYGTYKVELYNYNDTLVMIDGFRVYNTMLSNAATTEQKAGPAHDVYAKDLEEDPSFIEVRDAVILGSNAESSDKEEESSDADTEYFEQVYNEELVKASDTTFSALITNATEEYDRAELIENGPKNEMYLLAGESLVMNVETTRKVQVGLKAFTGAEGECTINGVEQDLGSEVDMFYPVTAEGHTQTDKETGTTTLTITITNTGKTPISITKLKISDDPSAALVPLTAGDFEQALIDLGLKKRPYKNPFQDVHDYDWSYDAVIWAGEKEITAGKDATHFAPDEFCTRGQAVTFIWRAAGEPKAETGTVNPFVDVTADDYYYDAVLWAVENGIVYGVDDTHFAPDSTCTRAQIITFINRWAHEAAAAEGTVNPFKDVAADAYYYDAVLWGVENGIVYGVEDDVFAPDNYCTRAQIVAFIFRYVGNK